MLRSIFSLIHRIKDSSEKKYNNTKSKAVIYCFTNPDETVNMNMEINGQPQKIRKSVDHREPKRVEPKREHSFTIETEAGDVVTCKHTSKTTIVPKSSTEEQKRVTFSNNEVNEEKTCDEMSGDADTGKAPQKGANVRDLIVNFPKGRVEISSKGKDQISLLLEQIQKMKTGLERLQEIAVQFNSSERFTEDINYLMNNIRPHLQEQGNKPETLKPQTKI